jgi:hypothetical protein
VLGMDSLKELAYIISRNKNTTISGVNAELEKDNSKLNQLFKALSSTEVDPDEQVAHLFEGNGYKKLKNRLRNYLLDYVFIMDIKQGNGAEHDMALVSCWKDLAAIKILLNQGAALAPIELAQRLLKQALQFRFTELILSVTKMLRVFYSTRIPDARKFEQYNKIYQHYNKIAHAENIVEDAYTDLITQYRFMKKTKTELSKQAFEAYEQVKPLLDENATYRLSRHAHILQLFGYMFLNDYRSSIEVCQSAIKKLHGPPYTNSQMINIFLYQKLACHTQLKQYEEGLEVAEESLALEVPGSLNWFKNRELTFILSLHTKNYQHAHEIFGKVCANPKFKELSGENSELWKIVEAYLQFLIHCGKIRIEGEAPINNFRLNKFLNEVPIFSKEKAGRNIPILIVQILMLIAKKRYDQAISRIENLARYSTRHLRKEGNFRSSCFTRLLQQIVVADFHKAGVMRRAEKYLDQLRTMPLDSANQDHEIEFIPYEDLWSLIVETLTTKFYYQSKTIDVKKDSKPRK